MYHFKVKFLKRIIMNMTSIFWKYGGLASISVNSATNKDNLLS